MGQGIMPNTVREGQEISFEIEWEPYLRLSVWHTED